ncbi:hypothetical protein BH23VER1_BH23VER1_13940 [soil metagenome]
MKKSLSMVTTMATIAAVLTASAVAALASGVPREATQVNDFTRSHWSYRPMVRPDVPAVDDPSWAANPVDAFLLAGLSDAGLSPNGPAPRAQLIRRATYDLTGLPPTPEETAAFVADDSPDAWTDLIERLLASPQYGEKWGRHWLDVVRYADSNGFERDSEKPFIWRYRDYVIDAFNDDMPYDQFVREQIAGDELGEVTAGSLVATGYHRLMQWDDEPADREQYRYDVLDDLVRVTTEGFMAMTVGCARCHDHKGDPIPQTDYYEMMAFFHGVAPMNQEGTLVDLPGVTSHASERRKIEEKRRRMLRDLDRVESTFPEGGSPRVALVSERAEWRYRTDAPGDGWSEVGFRPDESWATGTLGDLAGEIWAQATFGLVDVPAALDIQIHFGGAAAIFLNGRAVAALEPGSDRETRIPMGEGARGVLQTGRNVVAVHLKPDPGSDRHPILSAAVPAYYETASDTDRDRERALSLRNQIGALYDPHHHSGAKAFAVTEFGGEPKPMFVHSRGSAHAPAAQVEPAFPEIFGGGQAELPELAPGAKTSGRRRALAEWLSEPDHPRTARVMANRIWQHHFGRGLCPSPNDFGFLGEEVTHPDLLDWLATEFVAQGWSIKTMHRLIMESQAYRMSSAGRPDALAQDPQNSHFWRFNMRRLTAEEIRDSMLAFTGRLNLEQGGPSIYIPLSEAVLATSSTKAGKWGTSPDDQELRRSIYITVKRSLLPPQLTDFDFATTDTSCPVRFATTVPTQALGMLNGEFTNEQATHFADRLRAEIPGDPAAQVRRAFEIVKSAPPTGPEVATAQEFLARMRDDFGLGPDAALDRFCLLALNTNAFLYVD